MKPNKEKRFLDFQNILRALRLDNLPIVVEGKRDKCTNLPNYGCKENNWLTN